MFVHGHSLDVPVTVPSTDTRTWGGDMGCLSTDIPWTSQLLCHPQILGHGVEAWGVRPRTFPGRPSYCAIHRYQEMGWRHGVFVHRHSVDVPVTVPSTDTRISGHG